MGMRRGWTPALVDGPRSTVRRRLLACDQFDPREGGPPSPRIRTRKRAAIKCGTTSQAELEELLVTAIAAAVTVAVAIYNSSNRFRLHSSTTRGRQYFASDDHNMDQHISVLQLAVHARQTTSNLH